MDGRTKDVQMDAHKLRRFGAYLALAIALYIGAVILFIIFY
jgi:hypothetical protein